MSHSRKEWMDGEEGMKHLEMLFMALRLDLDT